MLKCNCHLALHHIIIVVLIIAPTYTQLIEIWWLVSLKPRISFGASQRLAKITRMQDCIIFIPISSVGAFSSNINAKPYEVYMTVVICVNLLNMTQTSSPSYYQTVGQHYGVIQLQRLAEERQSVFPERDVGQDTFVEGLEGGLAPARQRVAGYVLHGCLMVCNKTCAASGVRLYRRGCGLQPGELGRETLYHMASIIKILTVKCAACGNSIIFFFFMIIAI